MIYDKPLAAPGFTSYRCASPYGWVMIGAVNEHDAIKQAARSTAKPRVEDLQVWDGTTYVPVFKEE